jgi:predicted ArsR family transcriptional regulator
VVRLLDDVGFSPETDDRATTVRLTRCPLLETAKEYPDVVCGVHLGIARGALEEYGADSTRTDLLPFAEPGACRLHLLTRAEHR